jgi:kynurenine formamidase
VNDPAAQYRAELDFEISFSNGGGLRGEAFRIDIDDTDDPERPAHSRLLAAGIPVCEHLTGLDALPAAGFRFSAVPPRVAGFGTFPVRAYATWPA